MTITQATSVEAPPDAGGGNTDPPDRKTRHLLGWVIAGLAIVATIALVILTVSTDRTPTRLEQSFVGDAKDHPNYGNATAAPIVAPVTVGDAKDHPGYGRATAPATAEQPLVGDAKDHPNFGPVTAPATADQPFVGDAKDHVNFGPVECTKVPKTTVELCSVGP